MAHSYSNIWKIPITMLRFFTVYGPWGRPDMALFKFTKGILKNKKIDIYNNGKMYRDFTYIDDIVNGIKLIMKKPPNKNQIGKFKNDSLSNVAPFRILNIGNTKKIFLLDFIKQIEKELGKKAKRNYMPLQKGDVKQTLSSMRTLESQSSPDVIMRLKYEEMLILLLHGERGENLYALLSKLTDNISERLRRFMELHYLKEWKLTDYAQEFGASLTTFKELFNEHYGVSPRAWISERRLLHAHKLLLTSQMSMVDIAMEAGFSSQSYFTQSYRRRFGTTPSRARSGDEQVAVSR